MAVNFYDLCRICTANSDQKIHVFSAEGKRKNLNSKVAECLDLNIEEKDRLPKVLCAQCVQHVESNIEFRNMCKNSQATLMGWLNSATGGKVYIQDELAPGSGKSLSVLGSMNAKQIPLTVAQSLNQPTIFQGTDLLNSIIQVAGVQQQAIDADHQIENQKPMQQYTITVDNKLGKALTLEANKIQQQQHAQANEKDSKTNALEEFLKLKPNIKVTPIKKEPQKQQHLQSTPQQITIQTPQLPMQTTHQATPQLQQQLTPLQFQQLLQQQLQQQWQQQQLQQQLQQLTQLQPQQITITAPTASTLTTTTTSNASTALNGSLSPCKSKKPKINFVFTPPSTSQTGSVIQQLTATTSATPSGQQPQIQLQFQPTITTMQQQQQQHELQQQQQSQTNAANLLSNLAPFLQQAVNVSTPIGAPTGTTLLSPNKCFLPITIKDENSDQQIVAHIDAKNFVFPTTYQLQMKLQPQIATVDGQPIMQLTPTSIPATLQLTPQALTNQTFQALLNTTNSLQQTQILQPQQQQKALIQPVQQTVQQTQPQQKQQQYTQPIITSQQIIRPANNANNFISKNITNDAATSTNEQQQEEDVKPKIQTLSPQKYKITQLPGNTIEITPATDFPPTQQQPLQTLTTSTMSTSVPTQYGGITVQRISTAAKATNNNKPGNQQQQQVATVSSASNAAKSINETKTNVWNKQNVTISRIPVHSQLQQQNLQKLSQTNQQQTTQNKTDLHPQNNQHQLQKQQTSHKQPTTTSNEAKKAVRRVIPKKGTSVTKDTQQPQPQQQPQQSDAPNAITIATTVTDANNRTTKIELSPSVTSVKNGITTTRADATKAIKREATNTQKVSSNDAVTSLPTKDTTNTSSLSGFVCNQCQRVFKKKEHLTQHVKLHAGIRPFKCTQDGCDKDFSRKEHLLRHLISHTGQKMFNCDVCQKLFSRKDNLNKHKRIHSASQNSSNYSCSVCNKSFTVKAYYQEHMEMHTKQEATTEPPPKKKSNNSNVQRIASSQQSHQQSQQHPTQQIQIVQQQTQQQQQPQQQQQIMHLQLPTVVTTQDLAGNTITITQSNDPNKAIGNHDTTVLNLPSHLGNFVQLGQTQFVNTSTGEIVGHIKIDK